MDIDGWMVVVVDRSNQFRINVELFIKRDRKKTTAIDQFSSM